MIRHSSTPSLTAALATIAVMLTACSADAGNQASPGDDPATSTPTQAAPSPTGWTPLSEDSPEVLPAGRYGLTVAENVLPDLPWAVVDVPEGFGHFLSWILNGERVGGVSYWTVHAVYRDPCDTDVVEVDTVEEAAAAFRAQRRSGVTAPRPVTLDGYQGLYLELNVPGGIDFAACPKYHPWDIDAPGGLPYWQSPGRERLWILDVKGEVVILNASDDPDDPDVPESAREQLTAMVESVDFIARGPN